MVQINPPTVRVKFKKTGKLMYISHLDLVRTMMKVIVRAGLPLKYTEGFNPKPKLSFAAPLPTGVESESELMDIRLEYKMDEAEVISRLNANLTDELVALEAYYPNTKFTSLGFLSYEISIDTKGASQTLADKINSLTNEAELLIWKKTKSGDKEVNIRPLIRSANARYDGGLIFVDCILSSSPSDFLSPELFIKLLKNKCGILSDSDIMSEGYSVMRKCAYFNDMTEFR